MVNRYAGEIHINPIAILRGHDFNNDGAIADIDALLGQAGEITRKIAQQISDLRTILRKSGFDRPPQFRFADGGYIAVTGLTDAELLHLNKHGIIDLYDFATDRAWVKKYGAGFGLIWEDGKAVTL